MVERISAALEESAARGLDPDTFERTRRKKIGAYLRMLNSPEAIAGEFTRYRNKGADLFELIGVYESLTLEEANARLREHVHPQRRAVSVVRGDSA
jgi:predicted Zn-dependent peptidase